MKAPDLLKKSISAFWMKAWFDPLRIALLLSSLWGLQVAGQEIVLQETTDFGYNPGNLRMYSYTPSSLADGIYPLVVVLHGCTQSAHEVAAQTGWNKLADSLRFFVLYPQTHFGNNVTSCFRWFREKDIASDEGESRSIYQMIVRFLEKYPVDSTRIHITGLSAGGAMAVAMLARYPGLFHSGAIVAGGPYGAAWNFQSAKKAMRGKVQHTPDEWANLVRAQNPDFTDDYPIISVFHGTKDKTVHPETSKQLIAQWTSLHHSNGDPSFIEKNFTGHPLVEFQQYNTAAGESIARLYLIKDVKHALSISTGDALNQGGKTGRYTVDTGFHIPWQCAVDFGLTEAP